MLLRRRPTHGPVLLRSLARHPAGKRLPKPIRVHLTPAELDMALALPSCAACWDTGRIGRDACTLCDLASLLP